MADVHEKRQLLITAQDQLDRWIPDARIEAYRELFEGSDPILTQEDLELLDLLDSKLERRGGDGVWGTDGYGIIPGRLKDSNLSLGIVCTYHPQITSDSVLRGMDDVDDETEERINDALWEYSERVATNLEENLDRFLSQADAEIDTEADTRGRKFDP